MKIFIDANVFVAACGNSIGGSAYLFKIAAQEPTWHFVTSALAIQEARRNIQKKLIAHIQTFDQLILSPSLTIIYDPPLSVIEAAENIIVKKDAPILAAAVCAQADYLCTLDQKDFHIPSVRRWCKKLGLTIVMPRDLLVSWQKSQTI